MTIFDTLIDNLRSNAKDGGAAYDAKIDARQRRALPATPARSPQPLAEDGTPKASGPPEQLRELQSRAGGSAKDRRRARRRHS